MKKGRSIVQWMNTGLLLVPGFLYAVFSILLSSNRLFPEKNSNTIMLLNICQLLSLGVTIAKYASDQMLLAKLNPGEKAALFIFFKKRVIPLSVIFSAGIMFTSGIATSICLLLCIPIEVFVIITILEFNISKKYYLALMLSLLGYPLIFSLYIGLSFFYDLNIQHVLLIFSFTAILKFSSAFRLRRKSVSREGILMLSSQVPIQQAGNYLLFRSDQLIIATNILKYPFLKIMLPGDYLFYSKLMELFSGVATTMGPVLSKFTTYNSPEISYGSLFKNRNFIAFTIMALLFQFIASLILLKNLDCLHLMMLIPFALLVLLIVPVNMINYELYRTENLKTGNRNNLVSFFISFFVFFCAVYFNSPLIFSFIVPVQLMSFIIFYNLYNKKKGLTIH